MKSKFNTSLYVFGLSASFKTLLICSLFVLAISLNPVPSQAEDLSDYETDYEGEFLESDPLIINSMKTTMYEHVADDEDIEIVQNWINSGSKNDSSFEDDVLPILKDNCTKCHNPSSTMSDAVPDKPLTSYSETIPFLNPGLPPKPK